MGRLYGILPPCRPPAQRLPVWEEARKHAFQPHTQNAGTSQPAAQAARIRGLPADTMLRRGAGAGGGGVPGEIAYGRSENLHEETCT